MVPNTSLTLRPLTSQESTDARTLVTSVLADAPYVEPMLAALEKALVRPSSEYRAIAACNARGPVGLVVFGEIAGARGAGRIHLITVDAKARGEGVGIDLIEAACVRLREEGQRFVLIEIPAAARLRGLRRLVERGGFREEGRIDDYIRDGIALLILRRDL